MSMEMLGMLREYWKTDSKIDQDHIDDEIARIPNLHQKYLDLLVELKIRVFSKQSEFLKLKGDRSRFYNGALSKEELLDYGWDQYQGKIPLKSELERLLEVDPVLLKAEEKLFELKACFEFVEEILRHLKYRGQDLKTILEWRKFISGV